MGRDAEYSEQEPLVLLYIAGKLNEAKAVEGILERNGVDYLVEVDTYTGGVLFRSERAGAFFYVTEETRDRAAELLRQSGYRPVQDEK